MIEITGHHPYADEFPMATEDEIDGLAANIAVVGLANAITLTPDGLVLDGRNRIEACKRAGVEPHQTIRHGDDDDYKEFVIGVNTTGRRDSMTLPMAGASAALILGEEKRVNGQWRRNAVPKIRTESRSNWMWVMQQCGLVLDILGREPLRQIRDGEQNLNAIYEFAIAKRDEKRLKMEAAERIEAEEAESKAFIEETAPDLADQVGGTFQSFAEAQAVWEKRNREQAEAIRKEKAAKEAHDKAIRDNDQQTVRDVLGSLMRLESLAEPERRAHVRGCIANYPDAAPPTQRHMAEPGELRDLATALNLYANELEG